LEPRDLDEDHARASNRGPVLVRSAGWSFFGHEIVAIAARVSRFAAGAIGAIDIVVPHAKPPGAARANEVQDGDIELRLKGEQIIEIASVIVAPVFVLVRAWRINVPGI
jgi:hypothetical protein